MSDAITSRKVKQVEGRVGKEGEGRGPILGQLMLFECMEGVCVLSPASECDVLRRGA